MNSQLGLIQSLNSTRGSEPNFNTARGLESSTCSSVYKLSQPGSGIKPSRPKSNLMHISLKQTKQLGTNLLLVFKCMKYVQLVLKDK